jgi:hypothetical protein
MTGSAPKAAPYLVFEHATMRAHDNGRLTMLSKIILAAAVAMLVATTAADARSRYYGYGYGGYYGGYSSNGRNSFGGAGHHVGETNSN